MDNNDKERSRGIPSRTGIGKKSSIIEKFPGLGNPLILFWGLITIPDWGYINTPVAELEVMMSDLPHIQYHPRDTFSQELIEASKIVQEDIKKKSKQGGLAAALGLNVSDVESYNGKNRS